MFGPQSIKQKMLEDEKKFLSAAHPLEEDNPPEIDPEKLKLEKNDLKAMILAVFSVILPYFLAFFGLIGLVLLAFILGNR